MSAEDRKLQRRINLVRAAIETAREGLRPGEDRQLLQEIGLMLSSRVTLIEAEFTEACRALGLPVMTLHN